MEQCLPRRRRTTLLAGGLANLVIGAVNEFRTAKVYFSPSTRNCCCTHFRQIAGFP